MKKIEPKTGSQQADILEKAKLGWSVCINTNTIHQLRKKGWNFVYAGDSNCYRLKKGEYKPNARSIAQTKRNATLEIYRKQLTSIAEAPKSESAAKLRARAKAALTFVKFVQNKKEKSC